HAWPLHTNYKPIPYGLSDPMLQLPPSPPLSKDGPPPAPISSEERELHPRPHVSTSVAFQHLLPGSPNGAVGYPDW
ncbi:hypothetical protein AVEN_223701-1, partial [Araneus ventricosus]